MSSQNENDSKKLVGVLAQFDDADSLLEGGKATHDAGYEKLDAYSPFPVHGIDPAIGIKRTILPFICLFVGIGACGGGIFLQWYTNSASSSPVFPGYDYYISGKPLWSLPANIPVIFEIIVLSTAFAAFFGMLILNKLPRLANPLHRVARFRRVTNDKFFLMVDAEDSKFDLDRTTEELKEFGAVEVEPVYEDQTDQQLPSFVRTAGLLLAVILLIPPVLIFRASGMTSRAPRLHVNQDMDFQTKYKPQNVGPNLKDEDRADDDYLFADIRAARMPIPGTITVDGLETDSEYFHGIKEGSDSHAGDDHAVNEPSTQFVSLTQDAPQDQEIIPEPDWVTEFPSRLKIDESTLARGKKMYEINCVACHGYSGHGDGLVNKRALELAATGQAAWTEAKNLHHPEVIEQAVGRVFDTITNGRATMGSYGQRITVEDRWAIVLYIKALQKTIIDSDEKFIPPAPPADSSESNAGGEDGESNGDDESVGDDSIDDDSIDNEAADGESANGESNENSEESGDDGESSSDESSEEDKTESNQDNSDQE